jgi:hypothetical protein
MRRHHIVIPLAALLATLPLILHGCSCGHDFDFHLQNWLDAAQQLRHGTLYPRWAITPAFNAGEPRFLFYPPLSWMLGALLTFLVPIAAIPALYTFIALTAAGFAMHHFVRHFASSNATLLAATLYLANPYMLFNAFERTAYAELLAAAWIPLLFLAVLRKRPTIHGVAIPLALLWLTNAPAAVMGSYTFALLAIFRVVRATRLSSRPEDISQQQHDSESPGRLAITYITGTILGLALPAFYLIPAAYERRYVQIAMAIIPNMRIQDNFLFGHTADAPHNVVLHNASLLAVTLLAITFIATIALAMRRSTHNAQERFFPLILTILIAFLLVPLSTPIWLHLPELAFLQFPWRLLTILSALLAFTLALLFNAFRDSPRARTFALLGSPICALALSLLCVHLYRQSCAFSEAPTGVAQAFNTHHGVNPTDEYTPTNADNDTIRPNEPGYWLSTNPNAFAPNTTPNPGSADPNFDGYFLDNETLSTPAPRHFVVNFPQPETLILNLRDFPAWDVVRNATEHPEHIQRDDGLVAIALPAGPSTIDIHWRTTSDQQLGFAVSACALLLLAFSAHRSRKL